MMQPPENKRPRQFLITHFSRKLAAQSPISIRRDQLFCEPRPFPGETSRKSPSRKNEHLGVRIGEQPVRAHHEIKRSKMSGKGLTVLQVRHPPRLYSSQRIAGVKSLGSRILARRSNGRSGSSLLLRLRLVGWKTLSLARSGAPSCRLQARSGSTSRPSSRKMPPGPFQTNLAELGWSDSSGLINLLAVHFLKLKGRMQLTVRSLDQNISYCIQPSSLIPANEDLAEIPCDAKLAKSPYFSVTYGLKNCLSSSPLSPSAFVIPLHT